MYVRQLAWVNTAPKKAPSDKSKKDVLTRREKLSEDGIEELEMPECSALYLIAYLFEVGPSMPGGLGAAPLSQLEIRSWQANVGVELQPWEAQFLRRLSVEYLSQVHLAAEPDCPSPWVYAPYARPAPRAVAQSMKEYLKELVNL